MSVHADTTARSRWSIIVPIPPRRSGPAASTNKQGEEHTAPLNRETRAAIDRILNERPGIGRAPLFPKPSDPTEPIDRHLATKWLRKAERLAGVEPQDGTLWHVLRRKFVTEQKHFPVQDVARVGGWKSHAVVHDIYTQQDPGTMFEVVSSSRRLREAQ